MQLPTVCFLCGAAAQCESVPNTHGTLVFVNCTNDCPEYQIQRRAGVELERKPELIPDTLAKVKAFHAKNAEDVPVILMSDDYEVLRVTTRSQL